MKDIYRRKDKGVYNQESVEKIQNIKYNNSCNKENVSVGSVHMTYRWHGSIGPCINLGSRWT